MKEREKLLGRSLFTEAERRCLSAIWHDRSHGSQCVLRARCGGGVCRGGAGGACARQLEIMENAADAYQELLYFRMLNQFQRNSLYI